MTTNPAPPEVQVDFLLIGAGIMSVTLGVMLKRLEPGASLAFYERLGEVAAESTDAWNNAGTGHAAYCELNYTPEVNGQVPREKAVGISESFEVSKQFWTQLVREKVLDEPANFVRRTPHIAFVWGAENLEYFRKRYESLRASPLFEEMEYSENPAVLAQWMPLVMEGREPEMAVAATRMLSGTDVNFGALTRSMLQHLKSQPQVSVHLKQEVQALRQTADKRWQVKVRDESTGKVRQVSARFVFIGAGGHSILLLQKSGIPEGKGYGGFPVGGQWLKCTNPEVVKNHHAKVYGMASVGAPPMSVPHLDTRVIDGKEALLFGPYAGFSPKFLKRGSVMDLPLSIKLDNIISMLGVARDNLPLTWYLITQVLQSQAARIKSLHQYYPLAHPKDWTLEIAGQRVQVIKRDKKRGGVLQFGTEVVTSGDGSIAALLGASPGASTTVSIMLTLLGKCFPEEMKSTAWQEQLKLMIPSYGKKLHDNAELCRQVRRETTSALGLEHEA